MTTLDFPADMVTVGDFDLDGTPEYVVGRRDSRQLSVFSSWFNAERRQATISLDSQPVALTNGDLNGDGVLELAVAVVDARLEVLVCDPGLNFSLAKTVPLPAIPCDLDFQRVGSRPALVVASTACIHVVELNEAGPDEPIVSQSVNDAAIHLDSFRQRRSVDDFPAPGITGREREVVLLALKGMTARQIGATLFIADRTVETHLAHAYVKLGVRSRFELMARLSESSGTGSDSDKSAL